MTCMKWIQSVELVSGYTAMFFGEKQFKTSLGNEDYVHDAKMFRRFSAQQHGYWLPDSPDLPDSRENCQALLWVLFKWKAIGYDF